MVLVVAVAGYASHEVPSISLVDVPSDDMLCS